MLTINANENEVITAEFATHLKAVVMKRNIQIQYIKLTSLIDVIITSMIISILTVLRGWREENFKIN